MDTNLRDGRKMERLSVQTYNIHFLCMEAEI